MLSFSEFTYIAQTCLKIYLQSKMVHEIISFLLASISPLLKSERHLRHLRFQQNLDTDKVSEKLSEN